MMKSFRNLILSLFLAAGAAGFAACDGTTGPAGVAGPAGAAGATGAKGDTGAAGKSADEIARPYAYLKTWGIDSGMASCSDPALEGMDPFPGPPTLTALASGDAKVPVDSVKTTGGQINANNNLPGLCKVTIFKRASGDMFSFEAKSGKAADRVTEPDRTGTTSLGNETVTTVVRDYYGGTVTVKFTPSGAPEIMQRELLFTRCGDGKRPTVNNELTGDYRIEKTLETESIIEIASTTRNRQPKAGYDVKKYTTRVCVRFSAPGTVKCYERVAMQERNPSDDKIVNASANTPKETVMERIVLYKNGQFNPVAPMAAPAGIHSVLLGTGLINFPFGPVATAGTNAKFNLESAGKLCNLFGEEAVNKCGGQTPNPNPDRAGDCV